MGEIADMMLDGTLCEGCGEYIGEGDGYPQYCSASCAGDRGADQSQIKRNPGNRHSAKLNRGSDDDFLAIRKATDIEKLAGFLNARDYNFVNTGKKDRKGQPMIGLMFTMPGQRGDKRGLIVCTNQGLHDQVLPIVKAAKIERGNER